MTFTPGMLLLHEKYRVESLLGAGAFAEVYRALHLQLNAPRALKILHRDAAGLSSAEFGDYRTRFELEAQLGAQLHSPHVIGVHDFEEEEGALMLVMELAEKAGDRPWDGVEAAELLRESARNRAVAGIQISPRFTCSSWSLTESCSIVELEPAEPTPEPAIWRSL